MSRLTLLALVPLLAFGKPRAWHCSDYHPKLSHLMLVIPPGRTDSVDVLYWRRFPGDSVPTSKLPPRCKVRWVQVPPVNSDVTITQPTTLPLSRTRAYLSLLAPLNGVVVRITATVYYQ